MSRNEPSTLPEAGEPADGVPRMVPGHKWIRAVVDGRVVIDSRDFTYVWEIPYWPTWFFRPEDLRGELRTSDGAPRQRGDLPGAQRYDFHFAGGGGGLALFVGLGGCEGGVALFADFAHFDLFVGTFEDEGAVVDPLDVSHAVDFTSLH